MTMKTSNVLIIALFGFLLLSTIGVNYSLKSVYDNIDFADPYRGYSADTLTAFKYIKLDGKNFGVVSIQPGETFEVRAMNMQNRPDSLRAEWRSNGDTLSVNLSSNSDFKERFYDEGSFKGKPILYIFAPTLSGVYSHGIVSVIKDWQGESLTIKQSGKGVMLSKNRIGELSLRTDLGGYVNFDSENMINSATLEMRDSSTLVVQKNVFDSFQMQVDSTVQVTLPGSLLRKGVDL